MPYRFHTRLTRRHIVQLLGGSMFGMLTPLIDTPGLHAACAAKPRVGPSPSGPATAITLFLCGDVMIGRGIDQILPHPGDPYLYEPYMKTARGDGEICNAANVH